jgi:hypothetical protein
VEASAAVAASCRLELSIGLNECPNAFGAGTIFAGRVENIGIELFSAEAFSAIAYRRKRTLW